MPHALTLKSDLGEKLLISSIDGEERLGHPFCYKLKLLAKDAEVDMRKLLGTTMTATLTSDDGYKRYFNGIVREISQSGFEIHTAVADRRYAEYSVQLVPKLWLLSQKADCRIYKKLSVPKIIEKILGEMGVDFRPSLTGTYPPRDYCVQYRESYLNFISRLMEQEGIYYFFEHTQATHKMVLADALGAHKATPKFEKLEFLHVTGSKSRNIGVHEFSIAREVHTTKYSLEDYDPLKPRASLLAAETFGDMGHAHSVHGLESFDYPGGHDIVADGKRYAQVKVDARSVPLSQYSGTSNAFGLLTGALFKLADCPRHDANQEYLVTGASVKIENALDTSGGGKQNEEGFSCSFTAIESKHPFRTLPVAVRPVVVGLQTAVVCGLNGSMEAEDIVVDKYSRVQVIFFWNKLDKEKHDISCPVRVATPWAGKQWGAIHIPRVGQEVVVSFLEGDPDRPLIVGSVYNADHMPPYELPAHMTQSGIKSRSHKGGGAANFNEIRFEDKKGSEELFTHAEKDHREEVENDHFVDIGNDETEIIKGQRTHTIDKDETFTIKGKRTHTVTGLDKLTAHDNKTADVTLAYKLTAGTEISLVTGQSSIVMKADGSIAIKGVSLTIDGQMTVDVHAGLSLTAKSDLTSEYSAEVMTTLKALMMTVKGTAMTQVSGGIIMIG